MIEQTVEQLRDELAHAKFRASTFDTARADACAAQDALARECNKIAGLVEERDVKLAQARDELDEAEADFAMAAQSLAQARAALGGLYTSECPKCKSRNLKRGEQNLWCGDCGFFPIPYSQSTATKHKKELAQARAELKGLQVANRECGRQLAQRTNSRDYWVGKCQAAEIERDQIRKEAEGLRRQLKHAEDAHTYRFKEYDALEIDLCHAATGEAAIVEAAEAYLAQRKHRHLVMDEDCKNLQDVLGHRSEAAAKLLERLAEAELAAHVHDKACGELAQTVRTERAARQEAEKRIKEDDDYLRWLHQILSEGGYIFSANEDGVPVLSLNPMQKLKREKAEAEQRAERAEALEAAETALIAHINELDGRLEKAEQRAEALAALVTPELANLLEVLGKDGWPGVTNKAGARRLAAQIREALDDSQA